MFNTFQRILDYVEESVNPRVLNMFEHLVDEDFEEALIEAYNNHKKNNSKLESEMAAVAKRYR